MEQSTVFFIFVGILFVIISWFINHLNELRRRREMAAIASKLKLAFDHRRQKSLDRTYGFKFMGKGHDRYGYNWMSGDYNGRRIKVFDYHYAEGSGKNRREYKQTIVMLKSDIKLQALCIRPETAMDKFGAFFGFNDLDFESAQFSDLFHVSSDNRKWAYDVIHPRVMGLLLSHRSYHIEYLDDYVLAVIPDEALERRGISRMADLLREMLNFLPAYLKENSQKIASTHH